MERHEEWMVLQAHKFSDLSVARAAADFAKNTNMIVRSGTPQRPNCYDLSARERRCHKLREGNMARRVMAMMPGSSTHDSARGK